MYSKCQPYLGVGIKFSSSKVHALELSYNFQSRKRSDAY